MNENVQVVSGSVLCFLILFDCGHMTGTVSTKVRPRFLREKLFTYFPRKRPGHTTEVKHFSNVNYISKLNEMQCKHAFKP